MKLTHLIAAGLMIAGLGVSTSAASAQDRDERRFEQRDHRGPGWRGDRGRHRGWNNHRRCHTEWRHHRRVTVCR